MDKYVVYYSFPGSPKYIYDIVDSQSYAEALLSHIRRVIHGTRYTGILPAKS